jgi:hypothetical protein
LWVQEEEVGVMNSWPIFAMSAFGLDLPWFSQHVFLPLLLVFILFFGMESLIDLQIHSDSSLV